LSLTVESTDPAINPGARPTGETTEAAAAARVQELFDSIAPTYDLLNHLLSVGLDRWWWRKSAARFAAVLARSEARIADLCCGTGDMTAALLVRRPASAEPITGLDFSPQMLARARTKFPEANVVWTEGDAMNLPFADASLDLVTLAFGFRNLSNYAAGLREIARVLRPGGQIGILECNQPSGIRGALYNVHLHHILPLVGGWISGRPDEYRYLPDSIARFPRPPQMFALMKEAGFTDVAWDGYLLHAAGLYTGRRS
jgi:demethylmenaquinone methyltransferase / 2-methoxy-6-polyprenyl-1,4-benzoquinol methylase